jgi:hypothetical protein
VVERGKLRKMTDPEGLLVSLLGEMKGLLAHFKSEQISLWGEGHVRYDIERRNYEQGPVVELWAEVVQPSDWMLLYWMDLAPKKEGWNISSDFSKCHPDQGSKTIREIADLRGLSFEEMRERAPNLLRELLSSVVPQSR